MEKSSIQLKQLYRGLFLFLISLTFFLSILFWATNWLSVFVGVFSIFYWQREWVRSLLQPLITRWSQLVSFMLISILWAFFFESALQQRSFFVALGFYLPYFLVWYKIFQSRSLSSTQAFYIAGLSGVLFQLFVTKQIVVTFTQAPDILTGLLFSLLRIASVVTLAGALTTFPFIVLGKEKESKSKLGMWLLGLASYFIALIGYLVWVGVTKQLVINI